MNALKTPRKKNPQAPPDELASQCQRLVQWPARFAARRRRTYTPEITFWLFLAQVLSTGASCQEAVTRLLSRLALCGKRASANTAAYCKARLRLPQEALDLLLEDLNSKALARAPGAQPWCGRKVKVVDGSSVSMPDTPENQARYPQPTAQKEGCGFPVMRLVVLFSLRTGAVLAYARAALAVHERTLFHELWDQLERGDVVLADRGFCSYADFHVLGRRGVDCVMRKHQRRGKTSIIEKKLGGNDLLMRWNKNNICPAWLSKEAWEAMPQTMLVREITVVINTPGFRTTSITIATSLLDPRQFPAEAFAQLYRRRWMAELFLRDLKTTMGMDVLRCKSPSMIHKELTMYFIAYNLLRTAMLEAARQTKAPPIPSDSRPLSPPSGNGRRCSQECTTGPESMPRYTKKCSGQLPKTKSRTGRIAPSQEQKNEDQKTTRYSPSPEENSKKSPTETGIMWLKLVPF